MNHCHFPLKVPFHNATREDAMQSSGATADENNRPYKKG
jgi:hypothetical protein